MMVHLMMVQMMMVQMILKIFKKNTNLLLKYFQLRKNMNDAKDDTSKELKDELDKKKKN